MREIDKGKLVAVLGQLDEIEIQFSDLRIEAENGYDEAVILGTQSAFLRAGIFFLQMATGEKEVNTELKEYFNEFGAVWPVSAYVLKDQSDVDDLAARLSF